MKRIAFTMVSACVGSTCMTSAAAAATVVNTELAMAYVGNTNRLIQESKLMCTSEENENPHAPRLARQSVVRIVTVHGQRVILFVHVVPGTDANGLPDLNRQTRSITAVVPSADGESVVATSRHDQRIREEFSGSSFHPKRELKYMTTSVTSCRMN